MTTLLQISSWITFGWQEKNGGDVAEKAANAPLNSILASPMTLMIGVLILVYFIMIRPERRKRADMVSMLDNLRKNDRVVTIGGIFGTVVSVQQGAEDVSIRVDDNTRIKILRSAISRVVSEDSAKKKTE